MAIIDNELRTSVWKEIQSTLSSASITASDVENSSISVTIGGAYNNTREELPKIVINPVQAVPGEGQVSFDPSTFSSIKDVRVLIDVYATRLDHQDQVAQKVINALEDNPIAGLSIVGYDEEYLFVNQNNNSIHTRSFGFTFKR